MRGDAGRAHSSPGGAFGCPRVHLRRVDSTNDRARQLALAGAPHGTAVTAAEQSAGRGRQGRTWVAPPGSALLCSLVLRDPPPLLSLIAGVAVCDAVGARARVKWPNDIVVERDEKPPALAKLAGILVEGRPQEGWAVLGIGLNVAVRIAELPSELRDRAASLELAPSAIEPTFERLLEALQDRLTGQLEKTLEAWRALDALRGRDVSWAHPRSAPRAESHGRADGIDRDGHLMVRLDSGETTALSAGEVHLLSAG
jgi:BirA family biotin operon repressor/biotin-[acetyl-CoA-carboxylase] ligase